MTSPTARTLALLRADNYLAAVVETFNVFAGVRRDLFGLADVLAVRAGSPVLLVQCTTASNVSARLRKALASDALPVLLAAGVAFEVHGWGKRGPRGRRKLWACTRRAVATDDLPA